MSRPVFGEALPPGELTGTGAVFSSCGRYRYRLWRVWDHHAPLLVWVLLNPSTASATADDPTLRRCVGFARRWHAGGVILVNLFAARATHPRELAAMADPIGPENDEHIRWACRAPLLAQVVCGWGAQPIVERHSRGRFVRAAICSYRGVPWCLGTTKAGHPRHPLYCKADTPLQAFDAQP